MLLALLEQVLRWTVALVLLTAAAGKLAAADSRSELARTAASLAVRWLRAGPSARVGRAAAAGLPAVEAAAAALLVIPACQLWGFAAAAGLMAVFTAGVTLLLRSGVAAQCRCFGASRSLTALTAWRNAALAAASAAGGELTAIRADDDSAAFAVAGLCAAVLVVLAGRHWRDIAALAVLLRTANPPARTGARQ